MELYFTRHGKTQWNQERRFQGSNGDSPLLPQSYEEIKAFGKKVKYVPFKAIYPPVPDAIPHLIAQHAAADMVGRH